MGITWTFTGIFNRMTIGEHLEREARRATTDSTPLGVIFADIDHFKKINDNYGHLGGDAILREFADRLRGVLQGYEVMGRYGGEEFLIILPGWDFQISPSRTDELLDAIRSQPFKIDEGEIKVTCSLGVAVFRPSRGTDDFRELLRRADAALYVAKNSGRNQASFEVRSSSLANTGNDELTGSAEFLR